MSLQSKLMKVRDALVSVSENCYHYTRPTGIEKNYIVWAEDGEEE